MKNIHMLPTDKPSRVYKSKITQGVFISDNMSQHGDATYNVNIYITSDEEIKEGDWIIENNNLGKCTNELWVKRGASILTKKIILTTDQDLINDGVQAIDDEFLQWFVKNPSCEFVPIITTTVNNESLYKTNIGFESWRKEEPKQETVEEAANKIYPNDEYRDEYYCDMGELHREKFIEGAKWQQERMYSEAIEFAEWIRIKDFQTASKDNWIGLNMEYYTTQELFEQFKKK